MLDARLKRNKLHNKLGEHSFTISVHKEKKWICCLDGVYYCEQTAIKIKINWPTLALPVWKCCQIFNCRAESFWCFCCISTLCAGTYICTYKVGVWLLSISTTDHSQPKIDLMTTKFRQRKYWMISFPWDSKQAVDFYTCWVMSISSIWNWKAFTANKIN